MRYMFAEAQGRCLRGQGVLKPEEPASVGGLGSTRIAILATPRSGNTFLRLMLQQVLALDELPIYHPGDVDWTDLPERVIMQLHWPRTDYLQSLLNAAGVRVVTVSRHPFDVLVSILRFAQTEPDTVKWLWGEGGDEEALLDADPASERFARWAMSKRPLALLEVTQSWLADTRTEHIRYDALVESAESEIARLLDRWSLAPVSAISKAVETYSPRRVNELAGLSHAWIGSPGVWREVLPSALVEQLRIQYRDQLVRLGVSADAWTVLDDETARTRWHQLASDSPLPDDAYQGELQVLDRPVHAPVGSSVTCFVKVQNRGTIRWPNRNRYPRIRLGYRWVVSDESNGVTTERSHILKDPVVPGTATYQEATLTTPPEPGDYRLEIDLVHEGFRWFGCKNTFEVKVG
jgi:hypothetical protein